MTLKSSRRLRSILPVATAAALGVFLAIASNTLSWSGTSTFVVGSALAVVLGLFGTPLLLLGTQGKSVQGKGANAWPRPKGESIERQALLFGDFLSSTPQPSMSFETWTAQRLAEAVDATLASTSASQLAPTALALMRAGHTSNLLSAMNPRFESVFLPMRSQGAGLQIADFEFQRSANPFANIAGLKSPSSMEPAQLEPYAA